MIDGLFLVRDTNNLLRKKNITVKENVRFFFMHKPVSPTEIKTYIYLKQNCHSTLCKQSTITDFKLKNEHEY